METTIKIDGVEYPVRQTMAALVDFREATGKEAYEITGLSDACRMRAVCCTTKYAPRPRLTDAPLIWTSAHLPCA